MFNPFDKPIKKIYGPYQRVLSGKVRNQIVIQFEDGSKSSMSNARWIMTQHLGRRLGDEEHIDHINEDPSDDSLSNLQILSPGDNSRKSQVGKTSPLKGSELGFEHGTVYGFQKKRCTCESCSNAKREFNKNRNSKRRGSSKPRGPYNETAECGTRRSYRRGCRCDSCRYANATYAREQRELAKTV